MSVKFQITLPEGLAAQLKTEAKRRKTPLARFIRDTMEGELRQCRQAKHGRDPFAWMDGLIDDEPNVTSRIDEILYGKESSVK